MTDARPLNRSVIRAIAAALVVLAGVTLSSWLYLSPTWKHIHSEWWILPLLFIVDGVPMLIAAYIAGMFGDR